MPRIWMAGSGSEDPITVEINGREYSNLSRSGPLTPASSSPRASPAHRIRHSRLRQKPLLNISDEDMTALLQQQQSADENYNFRMYGDEKENGDGIDYSHLSPMISKQNYDPVDTIRVTLGRDRRGVEPGLRLPDNPDQQPVRFVSAEHELRPRGRQYDKTKTPAPKTRFRMPRNAEKVAFTTSRTKPGSDELVEVEIHKVCRDQLLERKQEFDAMKFPVSGKGLQAQNSFLQEHVINKYCRDCICAVLGVSHWKLTNIKVKAALPATVSKPVSNLNDRERVLLNRVRSIDNLEEEKMVSVRNISTLHGLTARPSNNAKSPQTRIQFENFVETHSQSNGRQHGVSFWLFAEFREITSTILQPLGPESTSLQPLSEVNISTSLMAEFNAQQARKGQESIGAHTCRAWFKAMRHVDKQPKHTDSCKKCHHLNRDLLLLLDFIKGSGAELTVTGQSAEGDSHAEEYPDPKPISGVQPSVEWVQKTAVFRATLVPGSRKKHKLSRAGLAHLATCVKCANDRALTGGAKIKGQQRGKRRKKHE